MPEYDVAIVGAGPGGYVAAIRAAQLGLKVALVERSEVGGICLNWGCIPSKALLFNAELVSLLKRADEFGISFDGLRLDYAKAVDRSRQVVQRLRRGVESLLKKNHIDLLKGEAVLRGPETLEIKGSGQRVEARWIILATGARPRSLPMLPLDGQRVLTSREGLEIRQPPSSLAIVGGGAVGCEFAYLFNAYGVKVTVVELLPRLLPNEDEEVSHLLERSFAKQGITVLTGTQVKGASVGAEGVTLQVAARDGAVKELAADQVLVAVGIQGNTEGLGLEEAGVQVERGFIKVDGGLATTVPGVYAIGDVTGLMPLAHVASAQGVMVVERLAGREVPPVDYAFMPRATYCHPQVASFGLTEEQAKQQGHQVKVGKFPLAANGKALAMGESEGMVKVVADARSGAILGAHLIGPQVTELLPEIAMSRLLEGTAAEVGFLVHAHPTLSEAVREAALAVNGEALHV